jgi:hypothetical protein
MASNAVMSPAECSILHYMTLPSFQPWMSWSDRYATKDCDHPGLYLLRRFDAQIPTKVDPLEAELIYVGVSCDRTLAKRWYEFNRSAYEQKNGHSGGWTFNELFCANEICPAHRWLYVASLPVYLEEPHLSAYTQFIERWLIWEHVQRYNKMPACNRK